MCEKEYVNIQTSEKLDWNRIKELPSNAMLKVKPQLWEELDLEKNEELGLDVFKYTRGSEIKLWWKCADCTETYDMTPYHKVKVNCKCPYCRGLRVGKFNNLEYKNPKLAKQWNTDKNVNKKPSEFTSNSGEKVWWLGECGHEWEARISERNKGNGCPYCRGLKVNETNCLNTTHPEISKFLLDNKIGDKYTYGASIKTDWLCDKCNKVTENRTISDTVRRGFRCAYCSDGFKFPEKVMMFLLDELDIKFKRQKRFEWSNGRVYDFYFELKGESYILETHGGQHYFDRTGLFGSEKSLKEEQENDEYKYRMAIENGIDNYIVVDCKYSEIEYIKESILSNVGMSKLIHNELDWENIFKKSSSSRLVECCELYDNDESITNKDIAILLGLTNATINKYLREGTKLGLCNFSLDINKKRRQKRLG